MPLRFFPFLLIPWFPQAGSASPRQAPMRLCAEILSYALEDPRYEPFVKALEDSVGEYAIGELMVHGYSTERWLTYSDFPKVKKSVDPERLASYRKQLQRFKRRGLKITLSGGGPAPPDPARALDAVEQGRLVDAAKPVAGAYPAVAAILLSAASSVSSRSSIFRSPCRTT